MTAIAELVLAVDPGPWAALGVEVVDDTAVVGGVRLRFDPSADGDGVVAWGLDGLPDDDGVPTDVDGLPTFAAMAPLPSGGPVVADGLGVVGFDHLVVMTSLLERTCRAIELATGEPLKRIREAGAVRQGFHRLGPVIVEVVQSPQVTSPVAAFWGFVWNVADLHDVCDRLGPGVISLPKPAVQPGRFIATVRGDLGLGAALALMSPHVRADARS